MPKAIFDPSKPSQDNINWKNIEKRIVHLQSRISRAKQQGHSRLVRDLQRLLVRSLSAQLFAAQQSSQTLRKLLHSRTKFLSKTFSSSQTKQKSPKKIENFYNLEVNPTPERKNILTKLWNLALLPAVIATSDKKTWRPIYGYTYEKNQQLLKIQNELFRNPSNWFLKIEGGKILSTLSTKWIEAHTPIEKYIVKMWMENINSNDEPTKTPSTFNQINTSTLFTLETHIMCLVENFLSEELNLKNNKKLLRYQNELLVIGTDKNELVTLGAKLLKFLALKNSMNEYLQPNVLTDGVKIDDWRFQKKGNRLVITIIKEKLREYKKYLKSTIKLTPDTSRMIETVNQLTNGWSSQYERISGSRKKLSDLNKYISDHLWHWACKRHSSKGKIWVFHKYWKKIQNKWTFTYLKNQTLYTLRDFSTKLTKT